MRAFLAAFCIAAAFLAHVLVAPASAAPKKLTAGGWARDLAASRDGRWLAAAPNGSAPVLFYVGPVPVVEPEGTVAKSPPERRVLKCPAARRGNMLVFTPDSEHLVVNPSSLLDEKGTILAK